MSEWEIDDSTSKYSQPSSSEWEVLTPTEESSTPLTLGQALAQAPSKMWEDFSRGAMNFAKNIPNYYESAQTKIPQALEALGGNPKQANKQLLAGLAELGQKTFNLPHDLTNYLSDRLNLIPKDINQKVQMGRMPDSNQQINAQFGVPQNAGEEAFRWGGRNANAILGMGGIANAINPMKLTPNNIARSIIREGDRQVNVHNRFYNELWRDADRVGVNTVPVNNTIVNGNLDFIRQYKSPRDYRSLENFSQHPTLPNAQTALTDIKGMRRSLDEKSRTSSLSGEERHLYDALEQTQNHIENNMFRDVHGNVNEGLANRYRGITNSYRENVVPYRYNKDIQAFRERELLAKQLVERLKIGEFGAKKGAKHPELYRSDALKKALVSLGLGGGLISGGYSGYQYLLDKNKQ